MGRCSHRSELPPLARGRVDDPRDATILPGITPARAGKRPCVLLSGVLPGNYPRSRGEELSSGDHFRPFLELPPLARGRAGFCPSYMKNPGITPARAGKSIRRPCQRRRAGNYPRSRGEESTALARSASGMELPPLARGRGGRYLVTGNAGGITPARAGKRSAFRSGTGRARNYPRSRGEERTPDLLIANDKELPPLARGRASRSQRCRAIAGITPARAEKSAIPRRHRSPGAELPPLARGRDH